MIERVVVGSECNCCGNNDFTPIEFTLGNTFKITYTFSNKNFIPHVMIPLHSFDMEINYYIENYPSQTYTVKKMGSITENCILYPNKSAIKVIFDNYTLNPGKLFADFHFMYYDPEIPDRMADSLITKFTGIVLTEE